MTISRITAPIMETTARKITRVVDRSEAPIATTVSSEVPKANKINPVLAPIMKAVNWFSERGFVKKAGTNVFNNNRKYIDGLGVASIVAKDGLGCYLYVTQSMNNKDIPDDKRKFVAALDLTNGLLMIGFQILMFFTVSHKVCQTKMFDKFFGKMFDRPIKKTYHQLIKGKPSYEDINGMQFTQEFNKIRENVKDAFGGLTSLAAATIVGKRMLVPFIATPLADKVEKKMNEMSATKTPENKQPENKDNQAVKEENKEEVKPQTVEPQKTEVQTDDGNTNLLAKYKK